VEKLTDWGSGGRVEGTLEAGTSVCTTAAVSGRAVISFVTTKGGSGGVLVFFIAAGGDENQKEKKGEEQPLFHGFDSLSSL